MVCQFFDFTGKPIEEGRRKEEGSCPEEDLPVKSKIRQTIVYSQFFFEILQNFDHATPP